MSDNEEKKKSKLLEKEDDVEDDKDDLDDADEDYIDLDEDKLFKKGDEMMTTTTQASKSLGENIVLWIRIRIESVFTIQVLCGSGSTRVNIG